MGSLSPYDDCSDRRALGDLLQCVRELVGVLQSRSDLGASVSRRAAVARPARRAAVARPARRVAVARPARRVGMWPFQKVLGDVASVCESVRDKQDIRSSMEFAFFASIFRLAYNDGMNLKIGERGVSGKQCLFLFGRMCFAFNVLSEAVNDSGLGRMGSGISDEFFNSDTINLEISYEGSEISRFSLGMLSALGSRLEKIISPSPGSRNEPSVMLLRQIVDLLVIKKEPFRLRSEYTNDCAFVYLQAELHDSDSETYSDEEFEEESVTGDSVEQEELPPRVVWFKNVLKGIEADIDSSLRVGHYTGVPCYSADVVEFGYRVLSHALISFSSIMCSTLSLDGKKQLDARGMSKLSRYDNAFYGSTAMKHSRLIDELRFTMRAATLMLSGPPFDTAGDTSAAKLVEILNAVSSGVRGFGSKFGTIFRPADLNDLMITVLISLGDSLWTVRESFSVFRIMGGTDLENVMLKIAARLKRAGH